MLEAEGVSVPPALGARRAGVLPRGAQEAEELPVVAVGVEELPEVAAVVAVDKIRVQKYKD